MRLLPAEAPGEEGGEGGYEMGLEGEDFAFEGCCGWGSGLLEVESIAVFEETWDCGEDVNEAHEGFVCLFKVGVRNVSPVVVFEKAPFS